MLAGAEIVESVSYKADTENAEVIAPGSSQDKAPGLAKLPTKDPVDMQFTNITCTVNLGINKGMFSKQYLLFIKHLSFRTHECTARVIKFFIMNICF